MSYDTSYVANFPPLAKISRHIGLADRNLRQFLCRLRVFAFFARTSITQSTLDVVGSVLPLLPSSSVVVKVNNLLIFYSMFSALLI